MMNLIKPALFKACEYRLFGITLCAGLKRPELILVMLVDKCLHCLDCRENRLPS
jgi:hypothetical protein